MGSFGHPVSIDECAITGYLEAHFTQRHRARKEPERWQRNAWNVATCALPPRDG